MRIDYQQPAWGGWVDNVLKLVNLRAEESERTVLMFAFYTATSVGLSWLEASTVALFLGEYGAKSLPIIYIASAAIGIVLSFLYSWMQQVLPLRRVIVLVVLLLAVPLLIFRLGLTATTATVAGLSVLSVTVLAMRLWLEAIYVLNDLNTTITANQLFNIREIKRTFPLINSGILVADVIGGFSLPLLVRLFRLPNVILVSALMVAIGAGILYYLTEAYRQFFPDSRIRRTTEEQMEFATSRLQQPLQRYIALLFAFFVLAQILYLLVDFQFLTQLELRNAQSQSPVEQIAIGVTLGFLGAGDPKSASDEIASFLGLFQGFLGIVEISTQWFASSRLIERLGVFFVTLCLPVIAIVLGLPLSIGLLPMFGGFVVLKFLDEWIRYTLLNSSSPVLFQPLPDHIRSDVQSVVRGNAEPISTGIAGLVFLAILWFAQDTMWQSKIFIGLILLVAAVWIAVIWVLRSRYVSLLVIGAERGELSLSAVDLPELKRRAMETLNRPDAEEDKRSCIELLSHIDPKNAGDVLAPVLPLLPADLQCQSLEVMMQHPNVAYLNQVRELIKQPLAPEVLAMALRYIWLTEAEPNIQQLRPYLRPEVDPVVRGTAASLMLRLGDPQNRAQATNTLRQMLTHRRERERVMGCRALGEAEYMQALRLYIPSLLQDESLRVRCALLEAIAATRLEEYYPSLLKGLTYKSTREAAMRSLVRLENEALTHARLVDWAEDINKPESVRLHAWSVIGQIGTIEARNILVSHLMTTWGKTRRNIADILLKIPHEMGINAVLDRMGRSGVELLIEQELLFVAQLQAALVDLGSEQVWGREADLLRRALQDAMSDAIERIFPLLKFLYRADTIQAAAYNLQSESRTNVALGLEILDNTIDISRKWVLLSILDRHSDQEKLQILEQMVPYQQMAPSDRLRYLLDLRHFLPDWPLACCYHLARYARWSVTPEQVIACIRHPTGFVREAVLFYLMVASPRALRELLPKLKDDPDRLVANQAQCMMKEIGRANGVATPTIDSTWHVAMENS
ncbi:MAG: MFS transporter [Cyanobacteria bacterium]|nr:MFS transporter [Cyanobacteriota bacterium]MDW8201653.1 MFS transporter [Cyanobacteriota bacterium SKYGB_h_bin112]